MPAVTRNKWIARFSLVAYVLLVCFGHALHALPGHQHDSHHHVGHSTESACCHELASQSGTESHLESNHADHEHGKKCCVFERYAKERDLQQHESSKSPHNQTALELKSKVSHDLCSICELLSSPQVAAIQLDRHSAVEFVQSAVAEAYCFYQLQSLSSFSARGPPAVHPLV
ncbi:MAG: hypothetical protein RLY14_1640 [Planctomycetota bacterium]|jgi:hypothetical protein